MLKGIGNWFIKKYPQNYIVKKQYIGAIIFFAFCFGFVSIYRPIDVQESRFFGFTLTMAIYCGAISLSIIGLVRILKIIKYFRNEDEWNLFKELLSITFILFGMGIIVYFIGFLIETPGNRWKFSVFLDSCSGTFLIGIIPFLFFTLLNYRHLLTSDIIQNLPSTTNQLFSEQNEQLIKIVSQLKKEELSFYPSQFIYAESDSNYVIFYLNINNQFQKKIIRNSITNIAQQFSTHPFLMRVHRAFIVNVKKVSLKRGNTLGYQIKLQGVENEIPVSRQNTKDFNKRLKQIHQSF